jgi:hypothetical protein
VRSLVLVRKHRVGLREMLQRLLDEIVLVLPLNEQTAWAP